MSADHALKTPSDTILIRLICILSRTSIGWQGCLESNQNVKWWFICGFSGESISSIALKFQIFWVYVRSCARIFSKVVYSFLRTFDHYAAGDIDGGGVAPLKLHLKDGPLNKFATTWCFAECLSWKWKSWLAWINKIQYMLVQQTSSCFWLVLQVQYWK